MQSNKKVEPTREKFIEICSKRAFGVGLDEYEPALLKSAEEKFNEIFKGAVQKDPRKMLEMNAMVTLAVQPFLDPLLREYSTIGDFKKIGYGDTAEVEIANVDEPEARFQDQSSDVPLGEISIKKIDVPLKFLSTGKSFDYHSFYRQDYKNLFQTLAASTLNGMYNKTQQYLFNLLTTTLQNSTGIKFTGTYSGELTKEAVDDMIVKISRVSGSKVSIIADFSVIAQISEFAGYKTVGSSVIPFYTPEIAREMNDKGYIGTYKGCSLFALKNSYDWKNSTPGNIKTYWSSADIFFVPAGLESPLKIIQRGDLTSLEGNTVSNGRVNTRYDLEFGAVVVPELERNIGYLYQT